MRGTAQLDILLQNKDLSADHLHIARKVADGQRIDFEEGVFLFEHGDLSYLGALANFIREQKNGDNTYFNRNFHIEPTNLCVYDCKFCSYSRLIKQRSDESAWAYSMDEMFDIVRKYDGQPVTEVHIVGGVLPQYDLPFYVDFFRRIKAHRPEMHIKALTPVEYHYIFKKAKVTYEEGMQMIKDAGVDSMPGGGAEIFHPEIREQIAADKCDADQWLRIHEIWHQLGMRSNATMLYGHIEKWHHRIDHLERLRQLQDKTAGFQTFIPLKFRNQDNQMSHVPESTTVEDLRNYAVSRIYLDNFDHIKAYWPMIGRQVAQMSLSFGVDDIDGTIDDTTKIYSMAGSEEQHPALSTRELVDLIRRVGRRAIERDTLYNILEDYSDKVFEDDKQWRGYYALPVVENAGS
ncbi:MAG: aminofutalosine synthase MqnE [Lewinellaceae bacterium]|nr:aminofutalosine synthase MqnE [Lewinellaceae bacterium]MCB9356103.1 aminofutalosine synthase MqnE [Lewinellaceae bacterium]